MQKSREKIGKMGMKSEENSSPEYGIYPDLRENSVSLPERKCEAESLLQKHHEGGRKAHHEGT
jgi:hypothetical protein